MRSEYRRGILKFGIAAAMIAVAMVCRYLTKTEDLSDLVWNALSLLRTGIYLSLIYMWMLSIRFRIRQSQVRNYLMMTGFLLLVWIADLQVQLRAQHERQLHLLVRVLYPDGTHSSDGGFRCLLSGQKGGLPDSVGISPSVHSFRHRNCCGFDQFLSSKSVFLSSGSGKSVSGLHLWTGVLLRHRLDSGGSDTVFCNFIWVFTFSSGMDFLHGE